MPSETASGFERQNWSLSRIRNGLITFGKFVGPGFMIAVAYSESLQCHTTKAQIAQHLIMMLDGMCRDMCPSQHLPRCNRNYDD